MKKILISGPYSTHNNGDMAMVVAFIEELKKSYKEELEFSVQTLDYVFDRTRYDEMGLSDVKLVKRSWFPTLPKLFVGKLMLFVWFPVINIILLLHSFLFWLTGKHFVANFLFSDYLKADLVVDISGDSLAGNCGLPLLLEHLYAIWVAHILGVPVVLLSQSVGPLKNFFIKKLTIGVLNRCKCVGLRDKPSQKFFAEAGGKMKIMTKVMDLAMLLPPSSIKNVRFLVLEKEKKKLPNSYIAINIGAPTLTKMYWPFEGKALDNMKIIFFPLFDYILDELNLPIVLVPHSTNGRKDDRSAAKALLRGYKRKDEVVVLENEYSCKNVKSILGAAECVISCRMHALVASLSLSVPSIGLGYSHKYEGVLGSPFNMNDYIMSVMDYPGGDEISENMLNKFKELYQKRVQIRTDLERVFSTKVRPKSMKNIDIVKAFLL